jgi:uncharacterized protein (TIGR02594 family)
LRHNHYAVDWHIVKRVAKGWRVSIAIPTWMKIADSFIGLHEIVGPKHNKIILWWLEKLNSWWRNDEAPWCGVFVAHCIKEAGLPYPKLYMRAKAWAEYGSLLRRDRLAPGAILVFDRAGGGHVGFYVGEDAGFYYVLGGNQSNAVNVMKLGKSRLVASRWPKGEPVIGKPVYLNGGSVSTNEA